MSGVHFHEVNKTFTLKERQVVALQNISVDIKEHEFVSIVGPSGCTCIEGRGRNMAAR